MGLISAISGFAKGWNNAAAPLSTASTPSGWLLSALGNSPTSTGLMVGPLSALTEPTVHAIAMIYSSDVAKTPLRLYRRLKDGGREEATDHPLHRLFFRRPNSWQSVFEFKELLQLSLILRGNAYAVLKYNERGFVTEMIPVFPDRVTLYQAPDGELFYRVARLGQHEHAVLEDEPILVPSRHMLHIRYASLDGLNGLSPIGFARETVALGLAQEGYATRFFGSGARPSGVLKTKETLSKDVFERLRSSWDSAYTGVNNAGKVAILEKGVEWQQLTMTSTDAQFLELRRFNVEQICRFYRMPLHKVNELSKATFSNIEHQSLEYVNDSLMPWFERWEEVLNRQLLMEDEDDLFFEFDVTKLLRGDTKTRYDAYTQGRNWGWLSVNEIRAREGMNPVPNGDQYLSPLNMAPLGQNPHAAPAGTPALGAASEQEATPPGKSADDPMRAILRALADHYLAEAEAKPAAAPAKETDDAVA